jgi:hypothetical protein
VRYNRVNAEFTEFAEITEVAEKTHELGRCKGPGKKRDKESTAGGEEGLQESGGVFCEKAAGDFNPVIEFGIGEDIETGAESAAFWVVSAIDEARDTCLDDGAGAHGAGLESDVKSGSRETVIAKKASGFADDDDFGVGGGIVVADGAIARESQNGALIDKQGTNWHFAGLGGGARFIQCEAHELEIVGHQAGE